jgi:hypothetical protein
MIDDQLHHPSGHDPASRRAKREKRGRAAKQGEPRVDSANVTNAVKRIFGSDASRKMAN